MILGVAGRNAAGKGAALAYLAGRGFRVLSLSDVLRDELARAGVEETRERMIAFGREFREREGPAALATRVLEQIEAGRDCAIDSIRHPAEVDTLAQGAEHFRLLWIDAEPALRFERMRARGRPGDPESFEVFRELEARELRGERPGDQHLLAVEAAAHDRVPNDGAVDELEARLDTLLARYRPIGESSERESR